MVVAFLAFLLPRERSAQKKKKLTLSLPPPFFFSFFEKKIIKKQFSEVTCATVDNDFKVVRIPEEVRPALERGAARFAAGSEQK